MIRVLVIDDEPMYMKFYRMAFKFIRDAKLFEASSGPEGIEKAVEELPQLVLVDYLMKPMDGAQTAWALKHDPRLRGKNIPVILVSSEVNETDVAQWLHDGIIQRFVKKQDVPRQIDQLVKEYVKI